MYLLSGRGAEATKPDNSGEEIDEPAPPTEPTEPTEAPKPQTQEPAQEPTKSVEQLAQEVIRGLWGNGSERKRRLTEAGYDYSEIQRRVNEIYEQRS